MAKKLEWFHITDFPLPIAQDFQKKVEGGVLKYNESLGFWDVYQGDKLVAHKDVKTNRYSFPVIEGGE